jgi:hypothetical protein
VPWGDEDQPPVAVTQVWWDLHPVLENLHPSARIIRPAPHTGEHTRWVVRGWVGAYVCGHSVRVHSRPEVCNAEESNGAHVRVHNLGSRREPERGVGGCLPAPQDVLRVPRTYLKYRC